MNRFLVYLLQVSLLKKTFALFVGLILFHFIYFFIVLSFLTHTDTGQLLSEFFLTT